MKTITISTENSETYSSISNFFIDYYMTEANGEFVKVYLYLVRLLSNNCAITVAEIADHFNLTENDICRAIKYWIARDVLKLTYDAKGHLSGIVLLPLHQPQSELKLQSDAVSILHASAEPEENIMPQQRFENAAQANVSQQRFENTAQANVSQQRFENTAQTAVSQQIASTVEAEDRFSADTEFTAPPKPKFTKQAMDEKLHDYDWADIVYQVETLFGKQISARDTETLMYIYDTLEFNIDLFEYLIEYCTTMGKKNCRYMEAVAIAWYNDGIKTRQQAKEQSVATNEIARIVFRALGIRRPHPTNIEMAYITTWSKDFGFTPEIIQKACDKAIAAKPSSANFAYINGILENWNKNNIKTLADIDNLDKAYAAKAAKTVPFKATGTESPSGFNNFQQTRMDDQLDEMEQLFLKEVNH